MFYTAGEKQGEDFHFNLVYFESIQNIDVVLPKKGKKAYSAVSQGKPQLPYYYILTVTLKKNKNDIEVCCCSPQDE